MSILCAVMMLFSALGLMGFTTYKAFAETGFLTEEQYTNSDLLLKNDGITYFAAKLLPHANVGRYL